jgi:dolichyl-phosphate beta-glucosyltransferase
LNPTVAAETIALSLILPAFNEAQRLPPYLEAVRCYLDQQYPGRYEVLVVDDGSSDGLDRLVEHVAAGWPQLRLLRHKHNLGKGAAVRSGVQAARGELLLFADADGATPIADEARLAEAIRQGADLAVGSRLLSGRQTHRSRSLLRGLAGRLFASLARRTLRLEVRDTQCGFKMFRGHVGRRLFALVRESGYLFDLELLGLAQRLGYRIAEVSINWTEIPGGHFSLARAVPRVLVGLPRLRRRLQDAPAGVEPQVPR